MVPAALKSQRGWTLLELVVSISISSLILAQLLASALTTSSLWLSTRSTAQSRGIIHKVERIAWRVLRAGELIPSLQPLRALTASETHQLLQHSASSGRRQLNHPASGALLLIATAPEKVSAVDRVRSSCSELRVCGRLPTDSSSRAWLGLGLDGAQLLTSQSPRELRWSASATPECEGSTSLGGMREHLLSLPLYPPMAPRFAPRCPANNSLLVPVTDIWILYLDLDHTLRIVSLLSNTNQPLARSDHDLKIVTLETEQQLSPPTISIRIHFSPKRGGPIVRVSQLGIVTTKLSLLDLIL